MWIHSLSRPLRDQHPGLGGLEGGDGGEDPPQDADPAWAGPAHPPPIIFFFSFYTFLHIICSVRCSLAIALPISFLSPTFSLPVRSQLSSTSGSHPYTAALQAPLAALQAPVSPLCSWFSSSCLYYA